MMYSIVKYKDGETSKIMEYIPVNLKTQAAFISVLRGRINKDPFSTFPQDGWGVYFDLVLNVQNKKNTEVRNVSYISRNFKCFVIQILFFEKNNNSKEIYWRGCKNIKHFTPLSKLERLVILNVGYTNISDISFLEKNKKIKKLYLYESKNINKKNNIYNRKDLIISE